MLYGKYLERKPQLPRHVQHQSFAQRRTPRVKIDMQDETINNPPTVVNMEWIIYVDHHANVGYTSMKLTARKTVTLTVIVPGT